MSDKKKNPIRILVGVAGLDGHDRGGKYITRVLRDAGCEGIWMGIRLSPEKIVASAVQEDCAVIGLSFHSGAHLKLAERVLTLLKENFADDIIVICGGVIPEADIPVLKKMGVREVFTPGTSDKEIVEKVLALFADASDEEK